MLSAGEDAGELEHSAAAGCEIAQPPWKTAWLFLKEPITHLLHDLTIPLLGFYPREMKTYVHVRIYT